jgi:D-inositol-3-phosphate glycosyltransferase
MTAAHSRHASDRVRPSAERLHVLQVTHYALPHAGGIESVVHELASELASRGHSVSHVASAAVRPGEATGFDAPYARYLVPARNPFEAQWGVPYPLMGRSLLWTLRSRVKAADVVHVHGFVYEPTLTAVGLARRYGKPLVLTEHTRSAPLLDQVLRRPGYVAYGNRIAEAGDAVAAASLGRWALRRAGVVCVFNEGVREMVRRLAPRTPVEWLESGIDLESFRPAEEGERERTRAKLGWDERPRVLFVGRATEKKGLPLALEAIREARGALQLVTAGIEGGSSQDEMVEALGPVPRTELAAIYRAVDALVVPSPSEGLPVSLQEALASGLPVVAASGGGYPAFLRNADPAVSLVPAEAAPLSAALLEAAALSRPLDSAVGLARRHFSRARSAERHEHLYRELIRE